MAEPARHPAREDARELDQAVRHLARVHQVRRQQEERHGQQDEGIVGLEHPVEHDERREPQLQHDHGNRRDAEREGHWHADQHEEEEAADEERAGEAGPDDHATRPRVAR